MNIPEWAIDMDTNGYGHVIIDQRRDPEDILSQRVILTQQQIKQVIAYAHKCEMESQMRYKSNG